MKEKRKIPKNRLSQTTKKTKKRARSPEEKKDQYNRLLTKGRELFLQLGSERFSMRLLAKALDMSTGNLYNYVKDKRDLWFAIIDGYFEEFSEGISDVISNHQGSFKELIDNVFEFYTSFAIEDLKRFEMMFLIPPPYSKKGVVKQETMQLHKSQLLLKEVIEKAIENNELKKGDSIYYTRFFSAVALGSVLEVFPLCKDSELHPDVEKPQDFFKFVREIAARIVLNNN